MLLMLCFLLLNLNSVINTADYYVIEGSNKDSVLIGSLLGTVIRLLDKYENQEIAGFEVAYDNNGYYFDADRGSNWWNYYFEPLVIGDRTMSQPKRLPNYLKSILGAEALFEMPHKRKQYLIEKYIHVRPELHHKVDGIIAQQFANNFTIGVVYFSIANFNVSLNDIFNAIKDQIEQYPDCKVLLVTDDKIIAKDLQSHFQDHLICLDLVLAPQDVVKLEWWLLHLLLLAKVDVLIDTGSLLSCLVKSFNADLKVIDLDIYWQIK